MATYWAKLWIDILDDPKIGPLPDWLWRRFVEFILAAKEHDRGGELQPVHALAWRLRSNEKQISEALEALAKVGVVSRDERGIWQLVNFAKRQAAVTDDERQRRKRVRERNGDGHVPVTERDIEEEAEQNRTEAEQNGSSCGDFVSANLAELSAAGITEPKRSQLARLSHVTPEYIRAHVAGANGAPLGAVIHRIQHGWDPPVVQNANPAEPRRYTEGAFADMLAHPGPEQEITCVWQDVIEIRRGKPVYGDPCGALVESGWLCPQHTGLVGAE